MNEILFINHERSNSQQNCGKQKPEMIKRI
jgi:hypothetical protein